MENWKCIVCDYVYIAELGDPDMGIDPNTEWKDVPEDWLCPLCGVGKEDFEEL